MFPSQNKCMICRDSLCPFPLQLIYDHSHTIWHKKVNRYWEHLNEQIGNLIGTQWEHTKKIKKIPPPPLKKISKEKKTIPLESSHCRHESSILKTIYHYFHFINLGVLIDMCPFFFNLKIFFNNLIFSFVLENHLGFLF
jgi:hypothetical protein